MRKHICKKCGKIYCTSSPDSYLCPDCASASRRNVMCNKVCALCGATFVDYPRSKYCSNCQATARREADRRHKKSGTQRPLGSVDICENCGKQYIVNSSRQRYCKDCSHTIVSENVKSAKRVYAREHRDENIARKAEMRANRRVCAVCGNLILSRTPTVTCSPECAKEQKRRNQAVADVKRGRAKPERIISKMVRKNPQSGIPGVSWHKGKWQLTINGKYIGLYNTIEDAAKARARAEEEYFQKFLQEHEKPEA